MVTLNLTTTPTSVEECPVTKLRTVTNEVRKLREAALEAQAQEELARARIEAQELARARIEAQANSRPVLPLEQDPNATDPNAAR